MIQQNEGSATINRLQLQQRKKNERKKKIESEKKEKKKNIRNNNEWKKRWLWQKCFFLICGFLIIFTDAHVHSFNNKVTKRRCVLFCKFSCDPMYVCTRTFFAMRHQKYPCDARVSWKRMRNGYRTQHTEPTWRITVVISQKLCSVDIRFCYDLDYNIKK